MKVVEFMEKKNNKNSSIERKNKNRNKKKIEKFKLSMFRNDDMPSITEVKNQILDAIKHGKHYFSSFKLTTVSQE